MKRKKIIKTKVIACLAICTMISNAYLPNLSAVYAATDEEQESVVTEGQTYGSIASTFSDENMAQAVANMLAAGDIHHEITQEDIDTATNWSAGFINQKISSIEGIEIFENLAALDISVNNIHDIHCLAGLKALKTLNLAYNNIHSLDGIAEATNLTILNARGNQITDISVLKNIGSYIDITEQTIVLEEEEVS